MSHYDLLRSGQLLQFNLSESPGLVALPSFHVMLALLLAYAVRHVRDVFPVAVGLSAVMIASAPTRVGHHLADAIAGIVFGVLSVVVVRRWMAARAPPRQTGSMRRIRPDQPALRRRSLPLSSVLSLLVPRR
ncbi:phosphatase PAP2 family protein [Burkholderia pyrrocinia]|uniref:phosphatase PAP2 family protein n=1 Tax=Burkholderia pyrrocinia TaxID=60550 RepID=UPI0030D24F96